jgi:hypothetical protein
MNDELLNDAIDRCGQALKLGSLLGLDHVWPHRPRDVALLDHDALLN